MTSARVAVKTKILLSLSCGRSRQSASINFFFSISTFSMMLTFAWTTHDYRTITLNTLQSNERLNRMLSATYTTVTRMSLITFYFPFNSVTLTFNWNVQIYINSAVVVIVTFNNCHLYSHEFDKNCFRYLKHSHRKFFRWVYHECTMSVPPQHSNKHVLFPPN